MGLLWLLCMTSGQTQMTATIQAPDRPENRMTDCEYILAFHVQFRNSVASLPVRLQYASTFSTVRMATPTYYITTERDHKIARRKADRKVVTLYLYSLFYGNKVPEANP